MAGLLGRAADGPGAAGAKKTDRALERTRKTVRMLDDIYAQNRIRRRPS